MISLQWNPFGAFSLAAMTLACGLGVLIYAARPDRPQNRLLALVVIIGGLSAGFYFGFATLARDPVSAHRAIQLGILLLVPLPAIYLLFLSTIRTSLVRVLQTRWAHTLMLLYVVGVIMLRVAWPDGFVGPVIPYARVAAWHLDPAAPMLATRGLVLGALAAAQLFGLLVAFSAYREATSVASRQQARAFAIAFGTRDLLQVAFIVGFAVLPGSTYPLGQILFVLMIPVVDLAFYVLLAYGILKTQLFDIDLRIKTLVEHGTVAAAFASVFFIVSEAVESLLPTQSFVVGLTASALIALALRRLQRAAARLADFLLPGVQRTPEYIGARKVEVYLHAVEASAGDGVITERERRILRQLRRDLEIDEAQVAQIEARVLGSRTAVPA